MNSTEANKTLVLDALAALSAGEYERYLSFMAEDLRFHIVGAEGRGGDTVGRQALWDDVLAKTTPSIGESGFREEIIHVVAEGDWVVTESRGYETTKNGDPYNNEYLCFFRLHEQKIAEIRYYLDTDLTRRAKGI